MNDYELSIFRSIASMMGKVSGVSVKTIYHKKLGINYGVLIYAGENLAFVSLGYSPPSADGEFRQYVVPAENLSKIDKDPNISLAEKYYELHGRWIVSPEDNRLTIYIILLNIVMMSINSYNHYKVDIVLISSDSTVNYLHVNEHFDEFAKEVRSNIVSFLNLFYVQLENKTTLMGMKFVPLSIGEVKNFNSIGTNFQRELFINHSVKNLILEKICPFFAFFAGYKTFKMRDAVFFNNPVLRKKIDSSKEYIQKLKLLYAMGKLNLSDDIEEVFQKKLSAPINFIEKNLLYSKYCVALAYNCYDFTMHFILNVKKRKMTVYDTILCDILTDHGVFQTTVFQILYGLYCLHSLTSVIHGDLHLGNIMIFFPGKIVRFNTKIGNKTYSHESSFKSAIIDFGRSIINYDKLIDSFPGDVDEVIFQNQRLKILAFKLIPKFMDENEKKIDVVIKHRYSEVFRILTGLDILNFLSHMFDYAEYILLESKEFLTKLYNFTIVHIKTQLEALIDGREVTEKYSAELLIENFYAPDSEPGRADYESEYKPLPKSEYTKPQMKTNLEEEGLSF